MVNIGQRIREVLLKKNYPVSTLARELGCDRKTVYRLFEKNSIDTHLLQRICLLLSHNFFEEYNGEVVKAGIK